MRKSVRVRGAAPRGEIGQNTSASAYLKTALRKCKIFENFSLDEIAFLGNVVAQFQEKTGKSVNYPCFLYNYFEAASSELWRGKKEIMETLSQGLPKSFAARWRAKRAFDGWITNPTQAFLFKIDRVPCRRVPPLPLFPRNGVESLHHFFVGGVFAFLLIFAVFSFRCAQTA